MYGNTLPGSVLIRNFWIRLKTKKAGTFALENLRWAVVSRDEIGPRAFGGCPNLSFAEVTSDVTWIAESAFDGCGPWVTLIAPRGSYAAEWAAENGIGVRFSD